MSREVRPTPDIPALIRRQRSQRAAEIVQRVLRERRRFGRTGDASDLPSVELGPGKTLSDYIIDERREDRSTT